MSATVIDGKAVAAEVKQRVAAEVERFAAERNGDVPGLATVLVGEDPASHVYVSNKRRQTEEVGMRSFHHELGEATPTEELLELLAELNASEVVDGILVQLPLPEQVDQDAVISSIDASSSAPIVRKNAAVAAHAASVRSAASRAPLHTDSSCAASRMLSVRSPGDSMRPASSAYSSVWCASASTAMLTSSISDQDMTVMRQLFIKPTSTVAMTFSNDPQLGLTCERFSGSAYATLATTSFTVRTASLR